MPPIAPSSCPKLAPGFTNMSAKPVSEVYRKFASQRTEPRWAPRFRLGVSLSCFAFSLLVKPLTNKANRFQHEIGDAGSR